MEEELINFILKKTKEIAVSIYNERTGSYVGAEQEEDVEFNGRKYKLTVSAFWESSRHYDFSVKGIGFDYENFGNCISF